MKRAQMAAIASPQQARSGMTRDEIVAFFERRQELYDDFDAAAHTLRGVFEAFLDMKVKMIGMLKAKPT